MLPSHYELQDLLQSKDPNPETNLLRSESDKRMREAVLKVPPIYRLVLVLHDMEGLGTSEVARVTGLREGTVRVRLHRARLLLRRSCGFSDQAGPVRGGDIHAVADDEPPKRPRHCREMFASLSDYIDGLADDPLSREMEKHLGDCKPCVAFLDSLKSAVDQCRTYEPVCDTTRAEELRKGLVAKYQAAVAAMPTHSN